MSIPLRPRPRFCAVQEALRAAAHGIHQTMNQAFMGASITRAAQPDRPSRPGSAASAAQAVPAGARVLPRVSGPLRRVVETVDLDRDGLGLPVQEPVVVVLVPGLRP